MSFDQCTSDALAQAIAADIAAEVTYSPVDPAGAARAAAMRAELL